MINRPEAWVCEYSKKQRCGDISPLDLWRPAGNPDYKRIAIIKGSHEDAVKFLEKWKLDNEPPILKPL